jgi:hypothetical protein
MIKALLTFTLTLMAVQEPDKNQPDTVNVAEKDLYMKAQYAGNAGLVSFGFGTYLLDEKFMADISYGYLPGFMNGVRIHTLMVKPAYNFLEHNAKPLTLSCYTGISASYSSGHNIYLKAPDHYPRDYYFGNAFHLNPFLGIRSGLNINSERLNRISFYAEIGTVDYELLYAFRNREIAVNEILNLCFGIMFHLKGNR